MRTDKPEFARNGAFMGPYHQSDLRSYVQCPRKFKLDMIGASRERLGLGLVKGITCHRVADMIHAQKLSQFEVGPTVLAIFEEELADPLVSEEYREKGRETTLPDLIKIMENYHDLNADADVLYSEVDFTFEIKNKAGKFIKFAGTIDQVRRDEQERLWLYDLKSNVQLPSQEFLKRDFQFSMYAYAIRHGTLHPQGQGSIQLDELPGIRWYHLMHLLPYKRANKKKGIAVGDLRGNPEIEVIRTEQDLRVFEREIMYPVASIRMGMFPMNPQTHGTCGGFCEFGDQCAAKSELPDVNFGDFIPEYMGEDKQD